jgi:hypothetical protein
MAGSRLCTGKKEAHRKQDKCSGEATVKIVGWGMICTAGSRQCRGKKEAHRKHRRVF